MKHIQRVRKVVTLAVKLEWLDKDPFAKYKCNFTPSTRKYLSDQELAAFEGLDGLNDRLQYVKDLFVFSCYSGLVYIDTMRLTSKNLVIGIDGSKWIYTDRQKSTQPVRIPLLPKAEELIAKYRTDPRAIYSGTLFPTISNQRLNSYLKELASLASIDSKITFHVARHTFATTVALMNGLPIETLSKILGHSKITTTQIYAKVLHQKVSSDMTNLRMVIKAKEEEKRKKEEEDKNKGNSDSKVS
jgi:integrase